MASKSRSRRNTAGRGFVNNTILECLLSGDKYGYEIIKEVKDKTDGKVVLKEPSLYSSLKRFEQKGYISSYWGDSDIGGRRHYYSLTEPGKKYFLGLKSPQKFDLDEEDDEIQNQQVEQLSLENINNEIYNIEEDNVEVDDSNYINNMSFNVEDKMKELLNEEHTQDNDISALTQLQPINENNDVIFDEINTSNLYEEDIEDKNELINEITEAVKENKDDIEYNDAKQEETTVYENYMYEHKFRKENKQELSNGTEKFVQYDLFNSNTNQTNYVDTPSLQPTEIVESSKKENITANKSETEISKEIPLIKEQEVEFFNWNELKRQAVTNKTSFSNSSLNKSNNYSLENNFVENNIENKNYKSKNDLHKLFESNLEETKPSKNKIFDNISPNKTNNKIFDNVKERIELSDAVIGTNNKKYNDEPELTPEQVELLNKKFNEKFNQIAEEKVNSKPELDYKKILGELYYHDIKTNDSNNDINFEKLETEYKENLETYKQEFVDNEIDDEKIENAINNAKIYSYNTLKESLSNDGFKFKPYSIDIKEEDTEQFVKINKVKFLYGSLLSLIMLLQIAGVFICLKVNDLIYSYDTVLYVIALIAVVATFIVYLIPYITKKDERKVKYYNLNYHIMFGALYLFCGLVLTYAVNLILGLNHANTLSYMSRLILPAILLTNFVIAPIIYKLVIENKNLK